MTTLIIQWVNAGRVYKDQLRIEDIYRDQLVTLCGGVDKAAQLKEQYLRAGEPEMHPWRVFNNIAKITACVELFPDERAKALFVDKFYPEGN